MNNDVIKDFKELTTEEYLNLVESMGCDNKENLEIIYSFVAFDEEGYLSKNHGVDGGMYVTGPGTDETVCRFIEKKKCDEIYYWKTVILEDEINSISSVDKKLYRLNALLNHINMKVNANPLILYGFDETEISGFIEYPESNPFRISCGIEPGIHDGRFRGALLKGEGAAYSKFKQRVHELINELNVNVIPSNSENDNRNHVIATPTLEHYLEPSAKNLLSPIVKLYKKEKPKRLAYMILALVHLGLMPESATLDNKAALARAISISIGKKISRQSLANHWKMENDSLRIIETEIIKDIQDELK